MASKYETYACVHCTKEVPWYEPGDPTWRDWEYAQKICSACRPAVLTSDARESRLPRPLAPCVCGAIEFVRAKLREHVGESREAAALHLAHRGDFKAGELYAIACRACGRTELRVTNIADVPIGRSFGTELTHFKAGEGPYR